MTFKILIRLALAFSGLSAGLAQTAAPTTAVKSPQAPDPAESFLQIMERAKALAKAKDLDTAELKLTALNAAPPDTAQWHLETAQKLNEMSNGLAREGHNDDTVVAVANLTLQHLNRASALARDANVHAQAEAASAIVYLRYLGDLTSAIKSYQAAAALDPKDPGIQQALSRLVSTEAMLKSRGNKATH